MTVILREENRNENMIIEYTKELETLPRGKITPKNVNGNTYYYLYYRDGKKVVSKYIGKDEEFLKKYAYPYFVEIGNAIFGLLEERDGKLYLPLSKFLMFIVYSPCKYFLYCNI